MPILDCTTFLQWCLPRLRMRWPGFRKVRRQVCKRLGRRLSELHLPHLDGYRDYLETHPEEWDILDSFCRITISRFYRDSMVFDALRARVLPYLADAAAAGGEKEIRAWSAGCAAGEEAYTLRILWKLEIEKKLPAPPALRVTATDIDPAMLERARTAVYPRGSLKHLPEEFRARAFLCAREQCRLLPEFQDGVELLQQDIRRQMPAGTFQLILCRNLVLTYFDENLQCALLKAVTDKITPGGYFVTGTHETLPQETERLTRLERMPWIYRKTEEGRIA